MNTVLLLRDNRFYIISGFEHRSEQQLSRNETTVTAELWSVVLHRGRCEGPVVCLWGLL